MTSITKNHESHYVAVLDNPQFSSVFTKVDLENIPEIGSDRTLGLGVSIISEQGIFKQLFSVNPNKACSPDQSLIPPWFLKTFAADIAPILTDTFQDSINSGTDSPQVEAGK